jgi:anaerobic selenocysteine-containing dehydrogenase
VVQLNPAIAPNQTKVPAAPAPDLFTVVLEQFQTDTADYADTLAGDDVSEHTDAYLPTGTITSR